jgi:hypothetical protein
MGGAIYYLLVDVDSIGGPNQTLNIMIGAGGDGLTGQSSVSAGLQSSAGGKTIIGVAGGGDLLDGYSSNASFATLVSPTYDGGYGLIFCNAIFNPGVGTSGNVTLSSIINYGGLSSGAISAANVAAAGANLVKPASSVTFFSSPLVDYSVNIANGGATGSTLGCTGAFKTIFGNFTPGLPGMGAGASVNSNSGSGGNGIRGSGGGAAGSARTGFLTGRGGRGGDGYVGIIAMR